MNNKPLKNINRIDISLTNQHGWQVRSHIGGQDRSKWFGDTQHSGVASALYSAMKYRDVMIDVLKK